jgi:hypothetical protein
MNYDPEGATESAGEAIAVLEREVQGDLERFRDFLESHGHETGAWRGQVQQSNGKHRKRAHVSASRLRSSATNLRTKFIPLTGASLLPS